MEYVGFCLIQPTIKFKDETYSPPKFPPKLEWHTIKIDEVEVGQVLACVEFFEVSSIVLFNYSVNIEVLIHIDFGNR